MDASSPTAVLDAWTALLHTERALQDKIEEQLKRAGLPPLDWYHVLQEIDATARGFLRQTSLQKSTQLAQYNVCRLVDRLEREQLVQRHTCQLDGRNNVVVITDKGRALRRSMAPVYAAAVEAHVGARLTADEAAQLRALLGKLNPD